MLMKTAQLFLKGGIRYFVLGLNMNDHVLGKKFRLSHIPYSNIVTAGKSFIVTELCRCTGENIQYAGYDKVGKFQF